MMFLSKMAAACLVAFSATALSAAEPEILCELGRERIYLGESVRYQVTLNHVDNPSPPELVGFDDFDVMPAGVQNLNSKQVTIINGRRSEVSVVAGLTAMYSRRGEVAGSRCPHQK